MTSLTISNFSAYYSNGLNYRDPRPITYSTGQPVLFQNCLYYAVDLGGNGIRETTQGIVSWNLTSNRLSILSMLYYSRIDSGTGQPGIFSDGAGDIFFDQETKTWHDFFVTWGSNDLDPALVLWQAILPFDPLTARGVQIVGGSSQVALSAVTSHSQYDPAVYRVGSEWYLYFIDTNGYAGWTSVYPHLAESTDLSSWTNVYCNTSYSNREGCGVFYMGNIPYLCTSNGIYYNATTGRQMGVFTYWDNSTSYHPWAIPVGVNGEYCLLTFTCDIQYGIWYGYGIGVLETYMDLGVEGHLSITVPSTAVAGTKLGPITVTAYDSVGDVMTNYEGSMSFGSSDPSAAVPFTYSNPFSFAAAYGGTHTFTNSFEFYTSGIQTITVSDGIYTSESAQITVYPSTLDHFKIATPQSTTAGASLDPVIVTALYANNDVDTTYSGSVYFTSSDNHAVLPYTSSYPHTFSSANMGQQSFSGFTLKTAGPNTITVVDSTTGVSATAVIGVDAGDFDHIAVSPSSAIITAGAQQSYGFTAYDAYGNTLTPVNGSASWSTDSAAGGNWVQSTATYTSQRAGNWTVTCTFAGKNATSSLTVNPGAFDHITCAINPTSVTAGSSATGTATAFDKLNNSIGVVTASWAVDPESGGSWSSNTYNSQRAGAWNITAAFSGKTATIQLNVNPGPVDHILISPSAASINGYSLISYNATAYDSQNNTLGLVNASWSTPTAAGGYWNNSTYTAEYGGWWAVTAAFSGKTATSTLDVTAYAIDAISDTNAIIYPSGIDIVPYSSSQTINYMAKSNCLLTNLIVDSNQESLSTYPDDYVFNSISANHTVQVISQPETTASPSPSPNPTLNDQKTTGTSTASPMPAVSEFPPAGIIPVFLATVAATLIFFRRHRRRD